MSTDPTAYTFSRVKAHKTLEGFHPPTIAFRMLCQAWLIDDATHWLPLHHELAQNLANLAWTPTAEECAALRPGLLAWAETQGLRDIVQTVLHACAQGQPDALGEGH